MKIDGVSLLKQDDVEKEIDVPNLFLLNGIASLMTWNIILTSLDFYQQTYQNHNVYLSFPIPYFVSFACGNFVFEWLSCKVSFKTLIVTGIIGTNIVLICMLMLSLFMKDQEVGYWMSMFLCLVLGQFSNIVQLSFMGEMNYFSVKTVSRYMVGTATAGLAANVLRMLGILLFGTEVKNISSIILYFVLVVLFNLFILYQNLCFFNTKTYKQIIQIPQTIKSNELAQISLLQQIKIIINKVLSTQKNCRPYPQYILFSFIFIFILFPGIALSKSTTLPKVWSSLLLLVAFNIGDTMGKIFGQFRSSFNAYSITYLLFARLFFLFTIPFLVVTFTQQDKLLNSNIFPFFNLWVFGLSGGIVINGSFVLMFQKAPYDEKKQAGVLGGICIQMGIMIGTFIALAAQDWLQKIS